MSLHEILSRLEKVKGPNGRYTACCPAHDDRRASLSISVGEDIYLIPNLQKLHETSLRLFGFCVILRYTCADCHDWRETARFSLKGVCIHGPKQQQ